MPTATQPIMTTRKYVRVRGRNQITLPADVISALGIRAGDFLEVAQGKDGSIYLRPTVLATVGSPEAARQEALAEQDIQHGRYETFSSPEEFLENVKIRGAQKSRR